jgi:hypothetical protein
MARAATRRFCHADFDVHQWNQVGVGKLLFLSGMWKWSAIAARSRAACASSRSTSSRVRLPVAPAGWEKMSAMPHK